MLGFNEWDVIYTIIRIANCSEGEEEQQNIRRLKKSFFSIFNCSLFDSEKNSITSRENKLSPNKLQVGAFSIYYFSLNFLLLLLIQYSYNLRKQDHDDFELTFIESREKFVKLCEL